MRPSIAAYSEEGFIPCAVCRRSPMEHRLTTDPDDPRLGHGSDTERTPQHDAYLVAAETGGFVRPVRRSYRHVACGTVTTMGQTIAETYARDPGFYGATFCCGCERHLPVSEFVWDGTNELVGS